MLRTRLLRLLLLPAALLLAVGVAYPAFAANGNAHFIKNATSATLSGSNLVVNFKESGLAAGSTETVTTSATATTTYECVNGGGKNPQASNKTTTQSQVSTSGTFTADQSGNIVGSETLSPPSAQSLGFSCPAGQTVTFVSVTYSNVKVTDTTSGATISLPGTFTFTNPSAP
jgi:hypothetical protein